MIEHAHNYIESGEILTPQEPEVKSSDVLDLVYHPEFFLNEIKDGLDENLARSLRSLLLQDIEE